MPDIVRFSISLEDDLLEKFDRYCQEQHFATRSEAVRQLIRDTLTTQAWEADSQDAAGTLTLVYDHHRQQLRDHLTQLQHDHTELVVSTLHAHLTHDLCLEVIVLRGPAARLREIASQLRGLKGIYKGELVMASAEEEADHSEHHHGAGHTDAGPKRQRGTA
jgi:CopG family transcriptional regulator, nickel-responsive regulator